MSERPTDQDQERAAGITGCRRDPGAVPGTSLAPIPFCATHDEDGNPPWERCRWAPVAAALAEERERARAPFLALAEELDAWATENDSAEPTNTDGLLRSITAGRVTRRIARDIRTAAEEIA